MRPRALQTLCCTAKASAQRGMALFLCAPARSQFVLQLLPRSAPRGFVNLSPGGGSCWTHPLANLNPRTWHSPRAMLLSLPVRSTPTCATQNAICEAPLCVCCSDPLVPMQHHFGSRPFMSHSGPLSGQNAEHNQPGLIQYQSISIDTWTPRNRFRDLSQKDPLLPQGIGSLRG